MSRKFVEQEAAGMSTGGNKESIKLGPGISSIDQYSGQDVDQVKSKLAALNPVIIQYIKGQSKLISQGFNFKVNHQWEQYPLVYSGKFCRLLHDDEHKFVQASDS